MSSSGASFSAAIDPHHDASRSIVLRYRNALRLLPAADDDARLKRRLERCSIAEGVRIAALGEYRGVSLSVLDETSGMHSGTLKSIDGCVTIASCLERGHGRIAFESGGNTGAALAAYGAHAGIESFCFVPAENVRLLDGCVFAAPDVHLIAVQDPGLVRTAAERFAAQHAIARVPQPEWRIAASRFLGCFLVEALLGGARFDWLVQTISAGFAPIGIYDTLAAHGFTAPASGAPRFLGVQQAANCAMVRAWRAGSAEIETQPVRSTAALLSPVMYDAHPFAYGTFERLRAILDATGGALATLRDTEFENALDEHPFGRELLDRLRTCGIAITCRDGRILERTGMIALVAALQEIDAGRIAEGSHVLCCLTSGAGQPDGLAVPELVVRDLAELEGESRTRWLRRAAHA